MAVLIAPKVCMVTYLRSTEHFTVDLEEIAHALSILFHGEFKVVICCDKTFSVNVACYDFPVELFHCSGTKFNRIFSFIHIFVQQIQKFEKDIKEGKNIDIEDYINTNNKSYQNKISKAGLTISNLTEKAIHKIIDGSFKLLSDLVGE